MNKLIDVAAGVAGGILGTLLMRQMMKMGAKLPQKMQPKMHGDPAEFILDKSEDLVGRSIPARVRDRSKPALSYIYGTTGPLVLGIVARKLGRGSIGRTLAAGAVMGTTASGGGPTGGPLGAGAIMGTIVWAVGSLGWLPAAGVAEPIHRQPIGATAQG